MVYMRQGTPFSEAYPDFVKQWHPDNELKPETTARSSNKKVLWQCEVSPEHTWEATPNSRFKNIDKVRGCPYCSGVLVNTGVNDLASQYPDVAKQWSSRNGLSPSEVHAGSHKKFWWVGDCGHEWDASPLTRTSQGDGCPYCAGKRVLKGFNDLRTRHPDLAKEWYDDHDVSTVTAGSGYRATWKGGCGHEWETEVIRRVQGEGCPYCAGKRVLKGFNDLASKRPDLEGMWHDSNPRRADEVTAGSSFMAAWVCPEGHITKARVIEKISYTTKCPVCEGTATAEGINDFATKHPDLVKQWVRGAKRPSEVRPMSNAIATWRCEEGHEWNAPFQRRVSGHGCPFCAGQRAITGVNDLASQHPDLVREWHPDNRVDPSEVAKGSSTRYKWKCSEGHEWEISPNSRTTRGGTGCPVCWSSGRSMMEADMAKFIEDSYCGKLIRHHKLQRLELDVYLPDSDIAFEFNGVHWHSEVRGRGKHAHITKVERCVDAGISLIQIWEDDWCNRRRAAEHLILRKLGAIPCVGGELTTCAVGEECAREFMESVHVHGFVEGSDYVAAKCGEEIQAVVVLQTTENKIEIVRYAAAVTGAFSTIIDAVTARAEEMGMKTVIAHSDNEISSGNALSRSGFSRTSDVSPGFKYLFRNVRIPQDSITRRDVCESLKLHYVESMGGSELAALNKLTRVWDSGKVRWKLDIGDTRATQGEHLRGVRLKP